MSPGDIRAVENPISAIFDLAEDVNREAATFRKLVRYATIFIIIWLMVDFLFVILTLRGNLLISLMLIGLFILGVATLGLLGRMNDFFKYYVLRHRAILSVRNDDPVVLIPKGANASTRFLKYLVSRNPKLASTYNPEMPSSQAVVQGRSGMLYTLEGYLVRRPSLFWRVFGVGYPGYQLMIKEFERAPKTEDFLSIKKAAEDIAAQNKIPPSRVIALWTRKRGEDLSEEAYNTLISQVVMLKHLNHRFASSLELIIENEDGSYEFIPYIADRI